MVLNNINHHHEAIQSMNQGVKGKTITYMHTHIYIRKLLDIPPHLMTLPSPQTNISTPHTPILHPTPHSTFHKPPTPQYPTPIDITSQHIPHEIIHIIRMYWSNIMYALKLFNEGNLYDSFIFYSALYYMEGSAWVCYCWNDGEGKLIKYHKYLIYIRKMVRFDLNLWNNTLNITMCQCHWVMSILTLNIHAGDHADLWKSRGAGQYTDEILQTVRDPTSLSAQH